MSVFSTKAIHFQLFDDSLSFFIYSVTSSYISSSPSTDAFSLETEFSQYIIDCNIITFYCSISFLLYFHHFSFMEVIFTASLPISSVLIIFLLIVQFYFATFVPISKRLQSAWDAFSHNVAAADIDFKHVLNSSCSNFFYIFFFSLRSSHVENRYNLVMTILNS